MILMLPSCKKEKSDKDNLPLFLILGLMQNAKVTFSGKFAGVSASLGKSIRSLPEGVTDILAISSNNNYHRFKIDTNGNFSININKGYNYIFIFIDANNNVKGTYKLNNLSLNSLPTHYAESVVNGGTLESNNSGNFIPVSNFNINEFLAQAGNLNLSEMGLVSSATRQILALSNIDTDGNGIIDLEEDLFIRVNFSQGWNGETISYSINNTKNQFFDPTPLRQSNPYNSLIFSIVNTKAQTNTVSLSLPAPNGCIEQNPGSKTIDYYPNLGWLANGSKGTQTKSFHYYFNFNCQDSSLSNIPGKGTYIFKDGSKSYTFKNIESFKVEDNETILIPTYKFNVSDDIITSLEYKFQKVSPNKIEDASDKEVNIIYGNSTWASGTICKDDSKAEIMCFVPYIKASGSVERCNLGNASGPKASHIGQKFSSLNSCYFYTIDTYGNHLTYTLKRLP